MPRLNKWERQHLKNLLSYEAMIEEVFNTAAREAAAIGVSIHKINTDKAFSFADYPSTARRVETLLESLKLGLQTVIVNGVRSEWTLANNKNNELCNQVFGDNVGKLPKAAYERYYSSNPEALEAFTQRKTAGLRLSDRVWNYTNQFKDEIEMGLDVGIRDGLSADEMSRQLRTFLKYPDKLFRRVKDKDGNLQLSKRAAAFHPGRGVYRSSYKNARRLAATESNIAYRTADYLRWQDLDFVVGILIEPSKSNHEPDICDDLKGRYPKDFKWTGWHPHCRCHALTINKTKEEIMADTQRILQGEDVAPTSQNSVTDVPKVFKEWLVDNDDRLQSASSVPYFILDNTKYTGVRQRYGAVGNVTGTKLGRTATKEAYKLYEDKQPPTFTKEVVGNTEEVARAFGIKTPPEPMAFLDADNGKGNILWGKGDEFAENCQSAVAVHEARLRGLNVTALGYDSTQGSVSYELGNHFEKIWQHPKTGKTPTPTVIRDDAFDKMLAKLNTSTKATGRYHIGINMKGDRGHVITAERFADGQMAYYDPQSGTFLKIEEYAAFAVEYLEILKVDKLLLRSDIITQIARWL